jgi:plasmid maintenance system antidote protein VapI
MTTMHRKPELQPMGKVLTMAMAAKGMSTIDAAEKLGVSGGTVSNYRNGKTKMTPRVASQLGRLLDLDPARLVAPGGKAAKKSTRQEKPGPAQRAVMLLEAREAHPNGHAVQTPSRASHGAGPGVSGVFGMQANADGTMAVWVRAADLTYDKGSALVRLLLDMGLVPGAVSA